MNSNDEISKLLFVVLMIMIVILAVLFVIYIIISKKTKEPKQKEEKIESKNKKVEVEQHKEMYNKQSIHEFMDFDKIEDNMIMRKDGRRFLMVIECQGVNYDLMSGIEKNGVEQGFIQFLNTLRYPIQLYIQTRTVNLESGIIRYKARLDEIRNRLERKRQELFRMQEAGYSQEDIEKVRFEVVREQNLYEYGKDIINSTERMSLNKNILRKHYYVIIEYMPEDVTNLAKEEISSMAFSELYTKAQTIVNSLNICGVQGKVLDSIQLAELLYVAYNRDESEVYEFRKALRAGYDELYVTAPNVLTKRIQELNKMVERKANELANEVVIESVGDIELEKRIEQQEKEMSNLIDQMAQRILKENVQYIGKNVADRASEKIAKRGRKRKQEEETTKEKGDKK